MKGKEGRRGGCWWVDRGVGGGDGNDYDGERWV